MFTDLIATSAFDNMLTDVFKGFDELMSSSRFNFNDSFPPLNVAITADNKNYILEAALTGYKKDWLQVSIDGTVITVKADVPDVEDNDKRYLKQRIKTTSFERKYTMPEGYDTDKAEVIYEDGLLTIIIPAAEKKENSRVLKIN